MTTTARVLDVGLEDGITRSSLAGFFPAALQVPSLDTALSIVCQRRPHLHPVNGVSVQLARQHARRAVRRHPQLTLDDATSIVLYTMEYEPRELSLYFMLNAALRSMERAEVRPWRDFIWLLMHALRKLPVASELTAYRGAKCTPTDLHLDMDPATGLPARGFEFTWSGFSSTACTQGVMSSFVGVEGQRTMLTLQLTEQRSKWRAKLSTSLCSPRRTSCCCPPIRISRSSPALMPAMVS